MEELPSKLPEVERGSFSRHAKSLRHKDPLDPASAQFSELTEHGVEQARLSARTELLSMLERAPAGAVLFIGAKSDQERTGNTAEVYGEELKKITEDREDILVLTKNDIDAMVSDDKEEGVQSSKISRLREVVNANPDKKIVVDYPLYIKQLGYDFEGRWTEKGKKTEYFDLLVKKHGGSHAKAVHEWIRENGRFTTTEGRVLQGPLPDDVARQYIQGLSRIYAFGKKQLGERPLIVHGTGHQWDLDAVATYLAKGKVTYDGFLDVMGRQEEDVEKHPIGESEFISDVTIDPKTHGASIHYRGKNYSTVLQEATSQI